MTERLIAYRNNSIREFVYDFSKNTMTDVCSARKTKCSFRSFEILKNDLIRQGFRLLPFNPRTHLFNSVEDAEEWCEFMHIPVFFTPKLNNQIGVA